MLHKVIDKVDVFYFICALMIQCTWASSSEITILIPVSMHKLLQQFNVIPMLRQHQVSTFSVKASFVPHFDKYASYSYLSRGCNMYYSLDI